MNNQEQLNDLLVLEKSNKKPVAGDIFVLSIRENLFCFGKVIQTNVESRDSFVNGMNLIFIFDYFSESDIFSDSIEEKDILLVDVINNQLWRKGFAKNIAFSEVKDSQINEDYGFWDMLRETYVDVSGKEIDYIPKYKGVYGLGSYGFIGKELQKIVAERGL